MTDAITALDELMPVPSQTRGRGEPWPTAARMWIYEGVQYASTIGRAIGRSQEQVCKIRRKDRWHEYRAQTAARQVAERHGLSLPLLMRSGVLDSQREAESEERGVRAGELRGVIGRIVAQMMVERDVGSQRMTRMVNALAASQALLDSLLGLDVAKRVGASAAIARQRHAAKPARLATVHSYRPAQPAAPEPDLQVIMP
jgi:hypothetical protein